MVFLEDQTSFQVSVFDDFAMLLFLNRKLGSHLCFNELGYLIDSGLLLIASLFL